MSKPIEPIKVAHAVNVTVTYHMSVAKLIGS